MWCVFMKHLSPRQVRHLKMILYSMNSYKIKLEDHKSKPVSKDFILSTSLVSSNITQIHPYYDKIHLICFVESYINIYPHHIARHNFSLLIWESVLVMQSTVCNWKSMLPSLYVWFSIDIYISYVGSYIHITFVHDLRVSQFYISTVLL